MKHWKNNGFGIWAIVQKDAKTLIGRRGLNLIDETSEVEVDFVLARSYWGKGYATEAARAALKFGFEKMKMETGWILANSPPVALESINVTQEEVQALEDALKKSSTAPLGLISDKMIDGSTSRGSPTIA